MFHLHARCTITCARRHRLRALLRYIQQLHRTSVVCPWRVVHHEGAFEPDVAIGLHVEEHVAIPFVEEGFLEVVGSTTNISEVQRR